MLIVDAANNSDRTDRFTEGLNNLKYKYNKCKKILMKTDNLYILEKIKSHIAIYDEVINILSNFYEQLQCPPA